MSLQGRLARMVRIVVTSASDSTTREGAFGTTDRATACGAACTVERDVGTETGLDWAAGDRVGAVVLDE